MAKALSARKFLDMCPLPLFGEGLFLLKNCAFRKSPPLIFHIENMNHEKCGGFEMYKNHIKRWIDVALSLTAAVLLSPVLAVTAVLIKLDSKGPVIFRQRRLGLHGKEFDIYKFRSMVQGAEHKGNGVYCEKGDSRVTRVGKIIRATSIDELPQIANILKGDMALIGPRPPLTYHPWTIDKYTEEQKKMFSVRPGITGWAQVNGRKAVEWNRRIRMNVWYAEHVSFLLDVKIFFMTIFKVLANADNENVGATVTKEKSK